MENNFKKSKFILDEHMVNTVKSYMPKNNKIQELADFFGMFADPTRLKIISALSMSEMCVTDLSNLLKINQTTVSHQLKTLRSLGMVKYRRDGKVIYYSLIDKIINDCLLIGVDCISIGL